MPDRHLLFWLLLPVVALLAGRSLLVAPAQREVGRAQQTLFAAEREELAAELATTRLRSEAERLQAKVTTMLSDADRMRNAETSARAQIARLDARRRSAWILPGQGGRGDTGR